MKTSELQGAALDWAVAEANGFAVIESYGTLWNQEYAPSNDWAKGGPIIEHEGLGVERDDQGVWFASYDLSADTAWGATGPTPLIAAMRCYVASKLGDDVEIPDELMENA